MAFLIDRYSIIASRQMRIERMTSSASTEFEPVTNRKKGTDGY